MRAKPNVLIVATRHGLVMANAGIDQSNLGAEDHGRRVLLLPRGRPIASARRLKERLDAHFGVDIGVIISDSVGRAWRLGTVGLAIGAAGVPVAVGPARREGPGRPAAGGDRGRLRRCGGGRAVLAMGEAAEGAPGRAGARPRLERAGAPGRRRWCGPRPRTCSDEPRDGSSQLRCALRRHRRRQAVARACAACWASGSPSSSTPATTSSTWASHISPDVDTALYTLGRRRQPGDRLGPARRDLDLHAARWRRLGGPTWFKLGDGDLATHVDRTHAARAPAQTLTDVTAHLAAKLGVARARPAHDGRSRAHRGRDRRGHARLPGLFRARAVPARGARHPLRGRGRGAAQPRRCSRRSPRRRLPASSSARPIPGSASIRSWRCRACARR